MDERQKKEGTMYRAPTRRSIRLQGADYAEAGAYFVTICTHERRETFGAMQDGHIVLSKLGQIVRGCLVRIPEHFANAEIKEFAVMPNHLHVLMALGVGARYIVQVRDRPRTAEQFQKPVKGSIPTIVRTFKAAVSREARKELNWGEKDLWQRNYFERVLRDGKEVADASRYIAENPKRWEWDVENQNRKEVKSKT